MRIDQNGNVGIGESNPVTKLGVLGGFALEPGTLVNLTADNQIVTVGNNSFLQLSSDNATATNRTFCLTTGSTAGQILILELLANNAELQNNANPCGGAGTVPLIAGSTWTPNANDVMVLLWDGSQWVQISRSAN
jgi:hypothetical protein